VNFDAKGNEQQYAAVSRGFQAPHDARVEKAICIATDLGTCETTRPCETNRKCDEDKRMSSLGSNTPHLWTKLYEIAVSEPNRAMRMERLLEAERAILERALMLEDEKEDHEAEKIALEEAAGFVREMKLSVMTDGVGKELAPGQHDKI
jgi:hypothetical protein